MTHAPILLTGFEPFGGLEINPSHEVTAALENLRIGGRPVVVACLPVSFTRAIDDLLRLIDRHEPCLTLCVGLAPQRTALSLERVAINLIDARIPDNDGAQPVDMPVIAGGQSAYFSSLPVKAMSARAQDIGCPTELSFSAGSYVCNAVFYTLMHALHDRPGMRGGFIHVPPVREEVSPTLAASAPTISRLVSGLRACIEVALEAEGDLKIGMGKEA